MPLINESIAGAVMIVSIVLAVGVVGTLLIYGWPTVNITNKHYYTSREEEERKQ